MIEIYSKTDCPYCEMAKVAMRGYRVQFTEYVIGSDITREEFFQKFPNARTVPQIILNGHHIGGYNDLTEWMKHNDLRNFFKG
jgi:glutaredoxin 3